MVKYGGMGRMRQSCVKRHCARPLLPVAAQCSVCQLDGWNQTPDPKKIVDLVIFYQTIIFSDPLYAKQNEEMLALLSKNR